MVPRARSGRRLALQSGLEGGGVRAVEAELGKNVVQLLGLDGGGRGKVNADTLARIDQGTEGVVPFPRFGQTLSHFPFVLNGDPSLFQGLEKFVGFGLVDEHVRSPLFECHVPLTPQNPIWKTRKAGQFVTVCAGVVWDEVYDK